MMDINPNSGNTVIGGFMGDIIQLEEYMTCDHCGEKFEELFGKGLYNGNKNAGFFCLDCYAIEFEEEFYE